MRLRLSNQGLKFYGDTIHIFEDDAFVGLNHLTFLDLSNCGLNKAPPLGPIKGNLANLHLSYNCFVDIAGDYFNAFTRLRSISLDHNKLLSVPNITPLTTTLTFLDLGGKEISAFEPFLTSTTLPTLRQLVVDDYNITYLGRDMIRCWSKLMTLKLRRNFLRNLGDLSEMIRESSPSLMVLYNTP